jgi:hypothetical protein
MGALLCCFGRPLPIPLPPNAATREREQSEPLMPPPAPARQQPRPPAPKLAPNHTPAPNPPRSAPRRATAPAATSGSVERITDAWKPIMSADPNDNVFLQLVRQQADWRMQMIANNMSEADASKLACAFFERQLRQLNLGALIDEQDEIYAHLISGGKQMICGGALPPPLAPVSASAHADAMGSGTGGSLPAMTDRQQYLDFMAQSGIPVDDYEDADGDGDDQTTRW